MFWRIDQYMQLKIVFNLTQCSINNVRISSYVLSENKTLSNPSINSLPLHVVPLLHPNFLCAEDTTRKNFCIDKIVELISNIISKVLIIFLIITKEEKNTIGSFQKEKGRRKETNKQKKAKEFNYFFLK